MVIVSSFRLEKDELYSITLKQRTTKSTSKVRRLSCDTSSTRDHKWRLRDHQRGCRGGNRYEKGGFRKLNKKGQQITENNINKNSKLLINQFKQIMNQ